MYSRCGCVEAALEVFRRVSSKDAVLWNVMIGGLAMHGHDRLAVDLFALMKETTTAPNKSTYIAAMFAQTVHIVLMCTKPKMVCT
ncbi:Pentatricopeptide repeat-containing protein [Platanthera zijinensis]|uniref:Pentatricopeptide repeat-containing protein n=1 Tax=Platanthera zijinensis TaxID=2320716 RepID=A0AAP0BX60_9ASPA